LTPRHTQPGVDVTRSILKEHRKWRNICGVGGGGSSDSGSRSGGGGGGGGGGSSSSSSSHCSRTYYTPFRLI